MPQPTTTGLLNALQGEPWRYVGETDQPAFENSWAADLAWLKMGFRIREPGVVDLQGKVLDGTPDTTIWTMPEGYRPNTLGVVNITGAIGSTMSAGLLVINSAGEVSGLRFGAGHETLWVDGQYFLNNPDLGT